MSEEIWKPIHGFESRYEISSHGRIISLIAGKRKILKANCGKFKKYKTIDLCMIPKFVTRTIHSLVAEHFLNNPQQKPCINHIDGDKGNNFARNLEWVTQKENVQHAIRMGLHNFKGENHPNAKLTREDVFDIRSLCEQSIFSYSEIAEQFSVGKQTIQNIINKKTWGWLI